MSNLASVAHAPDFAGYIEQLGYVGIYLWFITFDQLTPLPEEISLLTIGYLVSIGVFNPVVAGIVSILGFITIDTIYFFLAKGGSKLVRGRIKPNPLYTFISEKFHKNIVKTLVVMCFVPRMRLWGPIIAGSSPEVSYKRFIGIDLLALAPFTAIYIALGYFFHQTISRLFSDTAFQIFAFAAIVVAIGVVVLLVVRNYFKHRVPKE